MEENRYQNCCVINFDIETSLEHAILGMSCICLFFYFVAEDMSYIGKVYCYVSPNNDGPVF